MVCPFSLLSLLPTLVLSAVLATAASLPPLHNNGLAPLEERGHVEPVALVAPAINPPVAPVAPVNVAPVAPVASVLKNDDNKVEEHFSSGLPYNPDPYSPHPYYLGPTPRPKLPLQRDLLPLVDDRQHEPDALHQLMGKRYHEPSPPALSAVEVRHEVLVAIPEEPVQPDYSHADASDLEGEKAEGAGEAGIILRSAPDLNEEEWAQLFALCQAEGEADCEWMVVTGEDEHVEDVAEDDETDEEDDEDDDEDDEDEDDDDEDDDDDDDDEEE